MEAIAHVKETRADRKRRTREKAEGDRERLCGRGDSQAASVATFSVRTPVVPYKNIIGCISEDKEWLLASVWDPSQELFQGVIRCIHNDFRIGGLKPGEQKIIRGKMYLMKNDMKAFLDVYNRDFPTSKKIIKIQ